MKTKIIQIVHETEDIRSFRCKKLITNWIPGQWAYWKLDENLMRMFTISASPSEDFLQFTTKFRPESEYKQKLWSMKEGNEVDVDGPHGSFVLDEADTMPRLFLAGGMGMTPFRSMRKYILDKNLNLDTKVVASVKEKPEVFFSEFIDFQVITSLEGRVDKQKIKSLVGDWANRSWWLTGPAGFIDGMKELGLKMGISEEMIKTEDFPGY